ncbi:serine threonine kinase [Fusarium phyllophilum]|uniref:Serine threonine kinase n=1 Tax=Fusarium phyllophilum TaxID=47803 RepID=A0A8H5I7J7_9HYPO|nr:serine threonine kinase [Fusarium phyllophilum]
MDDRKKRLKNKMMRDWDGPDDKDMEVGWGANSSWTSPAYYSDNQVAVLDEKELDEHELAWEFELDKMEREARRILPGGLPHGKPSYNIASKIVTENVPKLRFFLKSPDPSKPPLYLFPAPVSYLQLHIMEEILANTHLVGRSFFEQFYRRNNSVTTLVSPQAWYVEPGYHECYIVGEPYEESSTIWDRAHIVVIDIPPGPQCGYEEGVEKLLDLARNVFRCQPTRVFLFGLFEAGKQREVWLFDRSGIYRSGLFDHECNVQEVLDVYGNMTDLELGMNPFIKQEFSGPQYIYIKGDGSKMAPYDSDHSREYKLVLDEEPLSYPGDIVSMKKSSCVERNVWGITQPIDYQYIDARATSLFCVVIPPFGRSITHYRTVWEVLECMRYTIKAHRSLYIDAKILHQDISLHNIFIANGKKNNPGASKGILIAFGTAMGVEIETEKPYRRWGHGKAVWGMIGAFKKAVVENSE